VQEATGLEDRKVFRLEKDRKALRTWLMQYDAERTRREQKKKKKKKKKMIMMMTMMMMIMIMMMMMMISRQSKEFREVALSELRI
jgi:ABC-type Na+ efflux pump permease subunit